LDDDRLTAAAQLHSLRTFLQLRTFFVVASLRCCCYLLITRCRLVARLFGCSVVRLLSLFGCSVAFVVVVVVSEWQWSTEDWEMADARWQTAADEL